MAVSLRVVLDQLTDEGDANLAEAEREIVRALIDTAPKGCDVTAIVPAGDEDAAAAIAGLGGVTRAPLSRGRLLAAWQIGLVPGIGAGLIHAPSLVAPLVRHDRVNDNDQTVVSLWDLCAWESPEGMSRGAVASQRALLKRAERHADAVVVPSHAMAQRLAETTRLGGRLRVIPGAAPAGFAVPTDAVGRRRELDVADGAIALAGGHCDDEALAAGLSALSCLGEAPSAVVLDVPEHRSPRVYELAAAAGLDASAVRVLAPLEAADRAAVLGSAVALLAPSTLSAFPWRVVEALALGVPVVASATDAHQEVLVDGGLFVPSVELGDALRRLVECAETHERFAVRALDRGKAFSWRDHAERVWALHSEL